MADYRTAYRRGWRKKSFLFLFFIFTEVPSVMVCWCWDARGAPPSPSAREQLRDGTGEAPSIIFLYCVPGTSICGLPGIPLLCGANAASVSRGPRGIWSRSTYLLGLLLSLFVGTRTTFSLRSTTACREASLVKRI